MFPRSKEEMIEELNTWVGDLNERVDDVVLIVEGKKDLTSLKNIGVECRIVHLNKGLSVLTFLETLKERGRPFEEIGTFQEVIILTDWDRTGGQLAHKLEDACKNLGMDHDMEARRELAKLTGKWIRDVESLDSLAS